MTAAQDIPAGTIVISSRVTGYGQQRDTHNVQTGLHTHIYLDQPGELLSHSCDPNLALRDNDQGAFDFFTLVPLTAGTELAFHYGMCEAESVAVHECHCGSEHCLGKSVGFWELPLDRQQALYELGIAQYLQDWYLAQRAGAGQ